MKKVLFLCFFGSIPSLFLCIAMYIYDPLQLYHLPYFREKNILSTNIRYQSAGLIHSWDFDSIILGSSILQNTSSKEAREKLGGKWINLSIAGSSLYERKIIFKHATHHHSISKLITSIDPFLFEDIHYISKPKKISFEYLHDLNHLNDFRLYLNEEYLLCLLHLSQICIKPVDPQYPRAWFKDYTQTFGGITNWIKQGKNPQMHSILQKIQNQTIRKNQIQLSQIHTMLKQTLLNMVFTKPKITFHIILPPFPTLYYKLTDKDILLYNLKQSIIFILKQNNPRIFVYGFDNEAFTNQIERYKDLEHYDEKVNSFMLDAIKNDTHRITLENVDSYFEEMRKKVEAYDIEPLRKQIIESGVLNH